MSRNMPVGFRTRLVDPPAGAVSRLIFFLFFSALMLSCATHRPLESFSEGGFQELLAEPGPKTLVVLPFETLTEDYDLAELVRISLYSHLSPRNYRDVEPALVDRILELKDEEPDTAWRELTPAELGTLLGADFLVYGKILNYQRTFLGVYSQIVLTVSLEVVSCKTGESVWRRTLTSRSHDGGVPFTPLAFIPAALRSGFHMKQQRTVGLVDRISRELAADIPEPPPALFAVQSFELQVASFLDRNKADMTMRRFGEEGSMARVEPVSMDGRVFHRVLLGPFGTAAEAEREKSRIMEETAFRPILIPVNDRQ